MAKKERKFDRRGLISYCAFGLVMMLLTYLAVAHTPLRHIIPGYPSRETQKAAIENYRKIDSLEKVVNLWAFQVANIQRVVTGRPALPLDSMQLTQVEPQDDSALQAAFQESDSLLRAQVQQLQAQVQANPAAGKIAALGGLSFKRPLKGTVREAFRPSGSHPFVDISAPAGTKAAAILDGRVVSAEWNELEGCTLRIRHDDDLVYTYRHAGSLLKRVGEKVKAGDDVATTGEAGELSEAFISLEIRYKNQAIDPLLYLSL